MTIPVQKFQQTNEEQQPLTDNAPENNIEENHGIENVEENKLEQPVETGEAGQDEGTTVGQIEATKPEDKQENEVQNENEEVKGQDENTVVGEKEA